MAIRITPSVSLDDDEIEERFVRAQGPGGQNVNKVATAVELRFRALDSPNLPDRAKARLPRIAGRRLTDDGVLILRAERTRSQARNRADALERLVEILREACAPPPKPRLATKPGRGAVERRLASKARRSTVKAARGRVRRDD